METVLTAVVSRLLKKFIRTTDGTRAPDGGESGGGAPGEDRQKQKKSQKRASSRLQQPSETYPGSWRHRRKMETT